MLVRGRLFQKPRGSDDSDDGYDAGGDLVSAKPLDNRIARKLDSSFRPRQFVTGSTKSHDEFYGNQQLMTHNQDDKNDSAQVELTSDERNKLNAKLMKAEMTGNKALAEKLRSKLSGQKNEKSMQATTSNSGHPDDQEKRKKRKREKDSKKKSKRHRSPSNSSKSDKSSDSEHDVLLTKTDFRSGLTMPVKASSSKSDAQKSIREMAAEERMTSAEDQLALMGDLASKSIATTKLNDDLTIDDLFVEKSAQKKKRKHKDKEEKREKRKKAQQIEGSPAFFRISHVGAYSIGYSVSVCIWHSANKFSILQTYLAVPDRKPLVDGHCFIVPMAHFSSLAQMDEDVFHEMKIWRKGLVAMCSSNEDDIIFLETASKLHQQPHAIVEAFPVPKEIGDVAPVYFKKAIMECEAEWADNKKLIELSKKDIRHSIPKGFSYFAVDFGLQGGYAHAIEDDNTFASNFGKEIIGGMLDLPHNLWRKPSECTVAEQLKLVSALKQQWAPFDWTERVKKQLAECQEEDKSE